MEIKINVSSENYEYLKSCADGVESVESCAERMLAVMIELVKEGDNKDG